MMQSIYTCTVLYIAVLLVTLSKLEPCEYWSFKLESNEIVIKCTNKINVFNFQFFIKLTLQHKECCIPLIILTYSLKVHMYIISLFSGNVLNLWIHSRRYVWLGIICEICDICKKLRHATKTWNQPKEFFKSTNSQMPLL